jgi:hypothetical protein
LQSFGKLQIVAEFQEVAEILSGGGNRNIVYVTPENYLQLSATFCNFLQLPVTPCNFL